MLAIGETQMVLTTPIYGLKRKAKLLGRQEGIPLHQALSRIAKQEGFASWALLIRDFEEIKPKPTSKAKSNYLIESLPVNAEYRKEAIDLANATFEGVMLRIEPDNPKAIRALWNAADYIDNHHLNSDMLPIDSHYALSLIEAFLVHHVVDLAVQTSGNRIELKSDG